MYMYGFNYSGCLVSLSTYKLLCVDLLFDKLSVMMFSQIKHYV